MMQPQPVCPCLMETTHLCNHCVISVTLQPCAADVIEHTHKSQNDHRRCPTLLHTWCLQFLYVTYNHVQHMVICLQINLYVYIYTYKQGTKLAT